jgi:hypothetical protein
VVKTLEKNVPLPKPKKKKWIVAEINGT